VTALVLQGVTVRYGERPVTHAVDVEVPAGTWLCLIGPNGAGKSSLLRAVAGLADYEGGVLVGGAHARALKPRARARAMAFVAQSPVVPDDMGVLDYVLLGRTAFVPTFGTESALDREHAALALERLDLRGFELRPLGTLSGGERQRVVLARSLAQQAPVLLLDEPTSALDIGHQQQVLELIDELRRERGLTVLSAMHDLTLAGQYADALVLLRNGRVMASGPADDVLTTDLLATHYGADVQVVRADDGSVAVVPRRVGARRAATRRG
jgi:iron complex transport system ATP-binding protein